MHGHINTMHLAEITWGTIKGLRRRLPLHFGEEARISRRYRKALLDAIFSKDITNNAQEKLAKKFLIEYQTPQSIDKFIERLEASGHKKRILTYLSQDLQNQNYKLLNSQPAAQRKLTKEAYESPERFTDSLNLIYERITLENASFSTLAKINFKQDKIILSPYSKANLSGRAILIIDRHFIVQSMDWTVFNSINALLIIILDFTIDPTIKTNIREVVRADINLTFIAAMQSETSPYSSGHQSASDLADTLAKAIFNKLALTLPSNEWGSSSLHPVLTLSLSDWLFRPMQRLIATRRAVNRALSIAPATIISTADSIDTAFENFEHVGPVLRWRSNPFPIRSLPSVPRSRMSPYKSFENVLFDKQSFVQKMLNRYWQSKRGLTPKLSAAKPKRVILSTAATSAAYLSYSTLVQEALQKTFDLISINVKMPASSKGLKFLKNQSLSSVINRPIDKHSRFMPVLALNAFKLCLADLKLSDEGVPLSAASLYASNSQAVEAGSHAILGLLALYNAGQNTFSKTHTKALATLPGRDPINMTLAAAAMSKNIPVVDLQAVMVSSMARYKQPLADKILTLSDDMRKLYIDFFGIDYNNVETVGSPLMDAESQQVRHTDQRAARKILDIHPDKPVITYASQPQLSKMFKNTIKTLLDICKENNELTLCIKLHPAQDKSELIIAQTLLKSANLGSRVQLITDRTFLEVLCATSVLITHFSNTALTAKAADVPVISVQPPNAKLSADLEALGAAKAIDNLSDLSPTIKKALTLSVKDWQLSLEKTGSGPQLGDGRSLIRIKTIIADLTS